MESVPHTLHVLPGAFPGASMPSPPQPHGWSAPDIGRIPSIGLTFTRRNRTCHDKP